MKPSIAPRAGSVHGRQRGFTLIELMVALAVGLVLTLAITGTVLTMGRQFRIVGSNAAAQGSAQIALSLIDRAGRSAGAGMFSGGQLLCTTLNAWNNGATKSNDAVFLPVRIIDGGTDKLSDTIVFSGSNAAGSLGVMPLMDSMANAGADVLVSRGGSIKNGDVALIGAPGSGQPCTLFQVTAAPTDLAGLASCGNNATACQSLQRAGNDVTGYNPTTPATAFANPVKYGFVTPSVPPVYGPAAVSRMGTDFVQQAFKVKCGALLQYNAFLGDPTGGCTENPLSFPAGVSALATDVVLMHAQYGLSNTGADDAVTSWVDATGLTWTAPTALNGGRIKAVRVVIVVRSREPGTGDVTAASCTNEAGIVNNGPCSFSDAQTPVIDLRDVAVPAGRNWKNYSYRVHQAVIPLRNVIWNN